MSRDPWKARGKAAKAARIGAKPIEPTLSNPMQALAEVIDKTFNQDVQPKRFGFVLMVWTFGDQAGRCNYVSNADRDDVKVLMREQLAYFGGMPEAAGKETVQ